MMKLLCCVCLCVLICNVWAQTRIVRYLHHLMQVGQFPCDPQQKQKQTAMFAFVVQVRDFEFSPDDGRIAGLVIDALGIPALPVKLLGCSSVKIQLVQNITWNCITLSPGSEAYIQKLTTGLFDNAVNVLRVSQLLAPHVTLFVMSYRLTLYLTRAVCQPKDTGVQQTAYKSSIKSLHAKPGLLMQWTAADQSTHSHSHQTCCQ